MVIDLDTARHTKHFVSVLYCGDCLNGSLGFEDRIAIVNKVILNVSGVRQDVTHSLELVEFSIGTLARQA